jgi:hypothetical protein
MLAAARYVGGIFMGQHPLSQLPMYIVAANAQPFLL